MDETGIAALLRADGDSPEAVDAAVDALLAARGLTPPGPGADPDDPRVGLWFVLRMAARTHRRAHAPRPPIDPARRARFEASLSDRPTRDDAHGQLAIDADSALRRAGVAAREAEGGAIIAIGDDDAVTLALALDGYEGGLHAVDIDPRLLALLGAAGISTSEADVFRTSVPDALRGRFRVAVTDPFRDLDGGLGFLTFAAACLSREPAGRLLWVDHPDWNFEHEQVRRSMEALGFVVREVHEDLHAYPLPAELVDAEGLAAAHGLDPAWLGALAARTRAWSSLYVLERAG